MKKRIAIIVSVVVVIALAIVAFLLFLPAYRNHKESKMWAENARLAEEALLDGRYYEAEGYIEKANGEADNLICCVEVEKARESFLNIMNYMAENGDSYALYYSFDDVVSRYEDFVCKIEDLECYGIDSIPEELRIKYNDYIEIVNATSEYLASSDGIEIETNVYDVMAVNINFLTMQSSIDNTSMTYSLNQLRSNNQITKDAIEFFSGNNSELCVDILFSNGEEKTVKADLFNKRIEKLVSSNNQLLTICQELVDDSASVHDGDARLYLTDTTIELLEWESTSRTLCSFSDGMLKGYLSYGALEDNRDRYMELLEMNIVYSLLVQD